jgi:hypothetical protein
MDAELAQALAKAEELRFWAGVQATTRGCRPIRTSGPVTSPNWRNGTTRPGTGSTTSERAAASAPWAAPDLLLPASG